MSWYLKGKNRVTGPLVSIDHLTQELLDRVVSLADVTKIKNELCVSTLRLFPAR